MKKKLKFGLLGLAAGAVGLGGAAALGNRLYDMAILPRTDDPEREADPDDPVYQGRIWLREHPSARTVTLEAVDGLSLHAYMLRSPRAEERRWAVCVHGYNQSAGAVGHLARHYAEGGWNLLIPDLRGHGKSGGDYVGFGWDDRLDLVAWCSWIIRRDPAARIVLHGVSMGAAACLMTTGGPLPKNVRGVVSDCAFTTARALMGHIYRENWKGFGPFSPLWHTLRSAVRRRAGYDLERVDAVAAVRRSTTPTLFIHGVADTLIPPVMMAELYENARCPKEFLWVPGAPHARSAAQDPQLYWSTVDGWLADVLAD